MLLTNKLILGYTVQVQYEYNNGEDTRIRTETKQFVGVWVRILPNDVGQADVRLYLLRVWRKPVVLCRAHPTVAPSATRRPEGSRWESAEQQCVIKRVWTGGKRVDSAEWALQYLCG